MVIKFDTFAQKNSEYLNGQLFSNGLFIEYLRNNLSYRVNFISQLFQSKHVIHLGCCDHVPLIKQKIQNHTWIHNIISESSTKCIGIDINKEAVEYVKNECDINNILYGDILKDNIPEINNSKWDYLFMGEILEHTDNPQLFLKTIRDKYKKNISKLVVTAPNALCYLNLICAIKNGECINTDHRYWFTPFTLAKLLTIAGYSTIEFCLIEPEKEIKTNLKTGIKILLKNPLKLLKLFILNKKPMLRETILMVAEL